MNFGNYFVEVKEERVEEKYFLFGFLNGDSKSEKRFEELNEKHLVERFNFIGWGGVFTK